MKITRIELHLIRVPFDMGAAPTAFAGMNWTSVDSLFVRVCTDADVDGWGEGWGHVACQTTSAALTTLVGPAFIGRDVSDRSAIDDGDVPPFPYPWRNGPGGVCTFRHRDCAMGHRRQTCVLADRIAAGGRATRADRLCQPVALRGARVGRIGR